LTGGDHPSSAGSAEGTGILVKDGIGDISQNRVENFICVPGLGGYGGMVDGIGIRADSSDISILNNVVGNIDLDPSGWGVPYGGGIVSNGQIVNNTIYDIKSDYWGYSGGILAKPGSIVINNLLLRNVIGVNISGSTTIVSLLNNNFYENGSAAYGYSEALIDFMNTDLAHCSGNISCSPGTLTSNYMLSAGSCCIDAGTGYLAPPHDFDGDPRPFGGGYDIGADEFGATFIPVSGHFGLIVLGLILSVLFIGLLLRKK
jgi:hypothetical protein